MFGNVRSILVDCFLLLCLQLCFEYVHTEKPRRDGDDHDAVGKGERISPVTSYFRPNLYGPNTYAFGFEVNDKATGNIQFRDEKRYSNGSVDGSYGYVRPDGTVSITHYKAEPGVGYSSQTQNFPPGEDAKWLDSWPTTKKPNIFLEQPEESQTPKVTYNEHEKLNLTSILLPVEEIKEQHGIDLNPSTLEKELVNPAVLEVINGEAPLVSSSNNDAKKTNEGFGFATVNEFIPSQFPIVPFQLPQSESVTNVNSKDTNKSHEGNKTKSSSEAKKYNKQKVNNFEKVQKTTGAPDALPSAAVKSKENNNEKAMPLEVLGATSSRGGKADNNVLVNTNSDWYDRFIYQAREKYLRDVKE